MNTKCPYCEEEIYASGNPNKIVRYGSFRRSSDSRRVQRFKCMRCIRVFSTATDHPCKWQKKRRFNNAIWKLLCSGVSQRRTALLLNLNHKTVVRTFIFLGQQAELALDELNRQRSQATEVQFDDLETFEHTKHKPLSATVALTEKRWILGFQVSQMAANGPGAKKSRAKYGIRKDERVAGRHKLFKKLQPLIDPHALIKSDQNPYYPKDVKRFFPSATHVTFKGVRGSLGGQGELKKTGFDPLFALNHTYAMLRANINRLFRKTWCTTKSPQRLRYHIAIYALFHNLVLLEES